MFDSAAKDNIMYALMVTMYMFMIMSTLIVFAVGMGTIIKAVI